MMKCGLQEENGNLMSTLNRYKIVNENLQGNLEEKK